MLVLDVFVYKTWYT